ncbi:MAG: UbiX family flavin prenyltransferase [Candidatus Melainabacteria bacterium]
MTPLIPPGHTEPPIVVGITGASGSILGLRLVAELLRLQQRVALIMTQKALPVIFEEVGLKIQGQDDNPVSVLVDFLQVPPESAPLLTIYSSHHLGAPPASGTHLTRGMVIAPCSMGTLGKITAGIADNLVTRAADVTLKENRRLILVPRETPLNTIHLRNMHTLSQMGVVMIPPMLAFYLREFDSLEGQIRYTVGKILDQLGFTQDLHPRWGDQPVSPGSRADCS